MNQLHSTEFLLSTFEYERLNIAGCCKQTFCVQFSSKAKHDFFFSFLSAVAYWMGAKIQISSNSCRGKWFHETEPRGLYLYCKDRLFVDLVKMGGKWERLLRFSHFCTEIKSCILCSVLAQLFQLKFLKIKPCNNQRTLPVRPIENLTFKSTF